MSQIKKFLFLTSFVLTHFLIAQINDKVEYLDSLYFESDKTNYSYKRIIKDYNINKDNYEVVEYYKDGNIKSTSNYLDKNLEIKDGEEKRYYENGKLHKIYLYKNDTIEGKFEQYNVNGYLEMVGEYFRVKEEPYYKIYSYIDSTGTETIKNGNGYYKGIDIDVRSEGEIKNGYKEGVWKGYDLKKDYSFSEIYKNGKFIKGESKDKKGKEYSYKTKYNPISISNEEDFFKKIQLKIQNLYQSGKYNFNINIKILILVNENNKVTKMKSLSQTEDGLDKELIKILQLYEKQFVSAQYRGINIESYTIFPFMFAE